jgi:hypothetical protein
VSHEGVVSLSPESEQWNAHNAENEDEPCSGGVWPGDIHEPM